MALPLNDGFQVAAMDPIDTRIVLTKEQMLNANVDDYPDVYFAFCVDDGQWYRFDYEVASADPETGHFSKLELGGGTPSADSGPVSERPSADTSETGDKWYDPTTGKTYMVVVNSEGNKEWVETSPAPGEMIYDAEAGKILYFDGTEWKELGGDVEIKEASVGTSEPSPKEKGDRWLDTNQNPPVLKEYDGSAWQTVTSKKGDMMYDDTNDEILYYDGSEWKPIGGGVEKLPSLPASGEEGKVYYIENGGGTGIGQYEVYEDGKWFKLAKIWEGSTSDYQTLGGDTWSTNHPDVICFVND